MLYKDKQAAGDLDLCIYDMIAKILDVILYLKKKKKELLVRKNK